MISTPQAQPPSQRQLISIDALNEQAQLAMNTTVTLDQAAEKGREETRQKIADKETVVAAVAKAQEKEVTMDLEDQKEGEDNDEDDMENMKDNDGLTNPELNKAGGPYDGGELYNNGSQYAVYDDDDLDEDQRSDDNRDSDNNCGANYYSGLGNGYKD